MASAASSGNAELLAGLRDWLVQVSDRQDLHLIQFLEGSDFEKALVTFLEHFHEIGDHGKDSVARVRFGASDVELSITEVYVPPNERSRFLDAAAGIGEKPQSERAPFAAIEREAAIWRMSGGHAERVG